MLMFLRRISAAKNDKYAVYANYIDMTDANSEGFLKCDERITENDRCVIKIIGIH